MSHFTVTVALPADVTDITEALTAALAPFDENLEVEQYEEDGETYWRNPQAKWDWWTIGGRWTGKFPARFPVADMDALVFGKPSWTNKDEPYPIGMVDGGRIRALDLEKARADAAEKGGKDWDEYAKAIEGTPQHLPWAHFSDRVRIAEENAPKPWGEMYDEAKARAYKAFDMTEVEVNALEYGPEYKRIGERVRQETDQARDAYQASLEYDIDRARRDYRAQPRIAALRATEQYKNWFDGPEARFDHLTRDEYIQQCRNEAIPGYAVLTDSGYWMAKGQMGWFGMDDANADSEQAYLASANKYIDSLAEDVWLVNVDCHI